MVPLQTVVAGNDKAVVEAVQTDLVQCGLGGPAVWFDKLAGLVGRQVEWVDKHSGLQH